MGSFVSQLAILAKIWFIKVRSYSAIFGHLYKKIPKIQTPIFCAIHFSEPLGGLFGLKIGMGDHLHRTDAAISWIFYFLILWSFLGIFVRNFGHFSGFSHFQTKMPKKDQKIKKSKIYEMAASVLCRWSPMPIFSPNRPPSGSNVKLAAKIRIQILTIFLYEWPKTAKNDFTLTDHISATVRNWKASEPILQRGYPGL